MDFVGIATVITAVGVLVGQLATFIVTVRTRTDVQVGNLATEEVKQEVTTGNSLTMAALADAGETRRIDLVPEGDRTAGDLEHLRSTQAGELDR